MRKGVFGAYAVSECPDQPAHPRGRSGLTDPLTKILATVEYTDKLQKPLDCAGWLVDLDIYCSRMPRRSLLPWHAPLIYSMRKLV